MFGICTLHQLMAATGWKRKKLEEKCHSAEVKAPTSNSRGRGRPSKSYLVEKLPEDIKSLHLAYRQGENHPCKIIPRKIDPLTLGNTDKELCVAKKFIVKECRKFLSTYRHGDILKAKAEFIRLLELSESGIYADVREKLGIFSVQTLDRWDTVLKANNDNEFSLVDRRTSWHRKGQTKIGQELAKIVIAVALSPNKPLISEVIRLARMRAEAEGIDCSMTDRTLRNFILDFKKNNLDKWVFLREGEKALNEACNPHIERDWDRVKVGDIVIADGHILNFEILNPFTGKPKRMMLIVWFDGASGYPLGWEISASESTSAISIAMRRAILCLGKIPKIAYLDNGRAFRGRFFSGVKDLRLEAFNGVFKDLGIQSIYAWPYHGESKPVERFFGTFSELERRAFSFVGTCIEDKPARLKRGEKLHKALHAHYTQGRIPTIEEAHHAIAKWVDEEYGARPQRGHLKGRTPLEVFQAGRGPGFNEEQETSLRILMAAHEIRGIKRDGITLPGSDTKYYHPDLYGCQLKSALVRFDWIDKSKIFIYMPDGRVIIAEPRKKTHPAAAYLGTPEEKLELEKQIEAQRSLKKQTTGPARTLLKTTILPEIQLLQENLGLKGALPGPSSVPAPEQPAPDPALTDAEIQAGVEVLDRLAADHKYAPWSEVLGYPDVQRWIQLCQMQVDGRDIPAPDSTWLYVFERGPLFRRYSAQFEEVRVDIALHHRAVRHA